MRTLLLGLTLVFFAASTFAQIVPPAPGVEIPPEVLQSVNEKGPGAFEFKHAWIEKTRKIRETRERLINERGFFKADLAPAVNRPQLAVTGTYSVPVFCVKYSNTGADPFPTGTLQTRLFTGPHAPQTLTEFYDEISYGDITLTGTVYGWTGLPNTDAYYAGAGTCNGLCGSSKVGELITTTLAANDGAVNFGLYDNDGVDGVPNSGDDDGFVDFVAFVHPEQGAECGEDGNIWSHRWVLEGWTGVPYTTNDARFGGGFIRVSDYVIQPAFNCGGLTVIDIGVFCHEFGHAFGLPDLYDTNGGSQGVGHWCLMGSGSWNTPTQPSHMSAWSKNQLGWSDVAVVSAVPTAYDIYDVETDRMIYRLDVMNERWRRMADCKITGNFSMRCGLVASEAALRNWGSGSGYGNRWDETVSRDFFYNGSGSVTLSYQYSYDLESTYDFAYARVTVGSTTTIVATYDGISSGTANINITPYVTGAPKPYTVSFRMTSDGAWSDEDGNWPTACGAMVLDNISVVGGGENHFADFEARENGWAPEMNPPTEHFLVENRQPIGSDVNVWGGGGLAIWHIDGADQTGGPSNNRPRGVAIEQADGLFELEGNINRGSPGDPYPGSTNNMAFNGGTTPNSNGNHAPSTVSVSLLTGNGNPISATMSGGWPAPVVSLVTPNTATSGSIVQIQIDGSAFAKVGSVDLVRPALTRTSSSVEWVGKDRIVATFDLTDVPNGFYDVVAFNPGNASGAVADAFQVTGAPTGVADAVPQQFALRANYPNPFNPSTTIRYDVATRSHVTLEVFDVRGAVVRTLVNDVKEPNAYSVQWDGRNDSGNTVSSGVYFYRLTAGGFSDVRKMTLMK